MAQEVYLDHLEDLTSELAQAEDMREGMLASVRNGLAGFAPWSWTRQMRLWQNSYEHDPAFRMESWDDRLGTQVHDDGTLKPAGQVFKDIAFVLRSIHFISFDQPNQLVITDIGQVNVALKDADGANSYTLVHCNGGKCFAAIALESFSWQGSPVVTGPTESYVYVLCVRSDIATSQQVLFKSEKPGSLRLHRSSPRSVSLVDIAAKTPTKLQELPWSSPNGLIEVTIRPTEQAYWILAEW